MDFSYLPGCMFPHLSPNGFLFFVQIKDRFQPNKCQVPIWLPEPSSDSFTSN